METNRIKIKIGDAEFEAEGPSEVINAQFEAFMGVVAARPKVVDAPTPPAASVVTPPPPPPPPRAAGVEDSTINRVFRQGELLSLAALPHGENAESSALLVILYGFLKLKNESAVTGTMLMKSARISGVNIDRVDRYMRPNQPTYVLAAGVKKGLRYQLNNPGIAKAEEIINEILQ